MSMPVTLEELDRQIAEAATHLEALRKQRREHFLARFGVAIGDVVLNRSGEEMRVTNVDAVVGGRPWLLGNRRKTDGEWGDREHALFGDWCKPDA